MATSTLLLTVLAAFAALSAMSEAALEISPKTRELFVKEGDPITLQCKIQTTSKDGSLKWIQPGAEGLESISVSPKGDSIHLENTVTIKQFSKDYDGIYTCEYKEFGTSKEQGKIHLKVIKEMKNEPTFGGKSDTNATLSCTLSDTGKDIKSVHWMKNNKNVSELKDPERFKEHNTTLLIDSPTREDAGLYVARFHIATMDSPYDCEVRYIATPLVLDFEKSKNLIQEDTMELQCKVKGYPYAVVTWYKGDQVLNGSSDRIELTPLDGYENARLKIKNVDFEDGGVYKCEAYSAYLNASDSKQITVRVKDKLAALWPFLGIVGEVLVLCTIIFIYERRRNKMVEQEEVNAQEADGASTDKKEGLRHRNTNNPTA